MVWDFLTRGIAKIIQAHVHPVCSISWSRSGRRVVSASTDNTVSIWDVVNGECDQKFRFPSPVLKVQFHPRVEEDILVTPMRHAAVVVTLSTDPTIPASNNHRTVPLDDENDPQIVASYDTRGKYIFTGNSRGKILIFEDKRPNDKCDFKQVSQFKVTQQASSTTAVKGIEFSRRGTLTDLYTCSLIQSILTLFLGGSFLVNTADRVIRVYKTRDVLKLANDK